MHELFQPDYKILFECSPGLCLILLPDFTIAGVSEEFLKATFTKKNEIIGKGLFEVFPDNPDDPNATGVANLKASLNRLLHNKDTDIMAVQKYDVRRPDGSFEEKYWSAQNKPVLNDKNEVEFIIHCVEDVTEFVMLKQHKEDKERINEELNNKVQSAETKVYKRAQEIQDVNKKLIAEIEERKSLQAQLKKLNEELEQQVKEKTSQIINIFERITDGFIALDKDLRYVYANNRIGKMTGVDPQAIVGKYIWDVFPEAIGSKTFHAFNTAMKEQHYIHNIDYYAPLDLWQENHLYPSEDGLSVFVKDITIQKRAQIKIEKEKDFSDSIINSLPGIFYLFDSKGKMLRWNTNFENVSGYSAEEIITMHPSVFFSDDDKPYIISRITEVFEKGFSDAETDFYTKKKKKLPYYFTGKLINVDGENCLLGTGIDIGAKVKAEKELKSSYEQIRALATHLQDVREEERAYIAREIHDELGQQLTGLKMDISWINKKLDDKNEDMKQKIHGTLALADEAVKTVRRIATELRPSILDDLGVIAAIEWQSSEFEKRFGIPVDFKTPLDDVTLQPDVATCLFRVYQESLTNILRHADAKQIESSITLNGNTLLLIIKDNGKGFDVNKVGEKKTLGLLGMKERTLIMGGQYEIISSPGKGTTVSVSVPLV